MASEYVFWDEMWNQSSEKKPTEETEYKEKTGGMGEWFKPAVLKTVEPQGSGSSNLSSSAK